ncbi:serine hydrolase domain-containing protein [Croceimicrobium hydrocarbonivorans]|uniref:serine hydrolase domain-containing protein n=1 Tax=Croceimicrobium hydrocarbonivorans TaxID=2761580 RepID=UPI001B354667|nr:serine hydrolase domain-containing protein [Croceimicrobium hydrocarbonivorans]
MKKLLIPSILFFSLSSCNFNKEQAVDHKGSSDQSLCFCQKEAIAKKTELEYGIREQVKFLDEEEELQSIQSKLTEYTIPALSLSVIEHGEISWSELYQNPAFATQSELDCSTIFQAASLSKPVTYMAALRMEAAGAIDMDRDIESYLKDFHLPEGEQSAENPVTFRNLFSHTSGISRGGYLGYDQDSALPSDLDILKGSPGVNTPAIQVALPPNFTLSYSGGGYTLAELALQDIFQAEFPEIMDQWILRPLQMKHSLFDQPLPDSLAPRVAKGHDTNGKMINGGWNNYPQQAAAGLWSTSQDMALFLIEIYKAYHGKSALFTQAEIEAMLDQQREGHVYGFIIQRAGNAISLTHYGGNVGYRSGMTINLTNGNGLVYLINSDNGADLGNELLLSASAVYDWPHFKQTAVSRGEISEDSLQALAGDYKWNDQIDLSLEFDTKHKQIVLVFPNGDRYGLCPVQSNGLQLIHPKTGVMISFRKEDALEVFSLYGQKAVRKRF